MLKIFLGMALGAVATVAMEALAVWLIIIKSNK